MQEQKTDSLIFRETSPFKKFNEKSYSVLPKSFCTLNFWFDEQIRDIRTTYLCMILLQTDADVLFLQEIHTNVVGYVVQALRCNYTTSETHINNIKKNTYGCMVFVHKRIGLGFKCDYIPFKNTHMSRGMAIMRREDEIYISTHLESYQTEQMRDIRVKQIEEITNIIQGYSNVVIGMDSNIRGELNFPDDITDWILKTNIKTWFGSRWFGTTGSEQYDRILTKGIFDNTPLYRITIGTVDCALYSDHDCVVMKHI